jgi:hypothetical protein
VIPEISLETGPLHAGVFRLGDIFETFEFFRPEGDFYWNLWEKIREEFEDGKFDADSIKDKDFKNERDTAVRALTAIVLTTTARTQSIERSLELLQLPQCKAWLPVCDVSWAEFELFRTSKRFCDELGVSFPEEIGNAKKVFGLRLLWGVERWKLKRTYWKNKDECISAIREYRNHILFIKEKENPYSVDNNPYMFRLLETMPSAPEYDSSWPNAVKRSWKELDSAFKGYLTSLAAYARAVDRGFNGGSFHLFGQNSTLISEHGRRRSLKRLTG